MIRIFHMVAELIRWMVEPDDRYTPRHAQHRPWRLTAPLRRARYAWARRRRQRLAQAAIAWAGTSDQWWAVRRADYRPALQTAGAW